MFRSNRRAGSADAGGGGGGGARLCFLFPILGGAELFPRDVTLVTLGPLRRHRDHGLREQGHRARRIGGLARSPEATASRPTAAASVRGSSPSASGSRRRRRRRRRRVVVVVILGGRAARGRPGLGRSGCRRTPAPARRRVRRRRARGGLARARAAARPFQFLSARRVVVARVGRRALSRPLRSLDGIHQSHRLRALAPRAPAGRSGRLFRSFRLLRGQARLLLRGGLVRGRSPHARGWYPLRPLQSRLFASLLLLGASGGFRPRLLRRRAFLGRFGRVPHADAARNGHRQHLLAALQVELPGLRDRELVDLFLQRDQRVRPGHLGEVARASIGGIERVHQHAVAELADGLPRVYLREAVGRGAARGRRDQRGASRERRGKGGGGARDDAERDPRARNRDRRRRASLAHA